MPRKANATIGTIACPITGEVAAVRKENGGRLYLVSSAGKITPYTELGQNWMLEQASLWVQGPPSGTPDWIVKGRASPPENPGNPTQVLESTRDAVPGPDPGLPTPDPDPDPDPEDDEPVGLFGL